MGMAASQARLLMITGRMHDLEFEAQSIQHAKLQLATQQDQVYEEYMRALDATSLTFASIDSSGTHSTLVANFNNLFGVNGANTATGNNYALIDSRGRVIVDEALYDGYYTFINEDNGYTQNAYGFAAYMIFGSDFMNDTGSGSFINTAITVLTENIDSDNMLSNLLDEAINGHRGDDGRPTGDGSGRPLDGSGNGSGNGSGPAGGTGSGNGGSGGSSGSGSGSSSTDAAHKIPASGGNIFSDSSHKVTTTATAVNNRGGAKSGTSVDPRSGAQGPDRSSGSGDRAVSVNPDDLRQLFTNPAYPEEASVFLNYFFSHYGNLIFNNNDFTEAERQPEFNYYVRMFNAIQQHGGCISIDDFNGPSGDAASNSEWLTNMIRSGQFSIEQFHVDNNGNITLSGASVNADQNLAYTNTTQIDKTALAKAEAEYEHALKVIDRKDKKFDLSLAKLETERNALDKQREGLKKVIEDNVERTFGIFS